jgi:hypothetical protein
MQQAEMSDRGCEDSQDSQNSQKKPPRVQFYWSTVAKSYVGLWLGHIAVYRAMKLAGVPVNMLSASDQMELCEK